MGINLCVDTSLDHILYGRSSDFFNEISNSDLYDCYNSSKIVSDLPGSRSGDEAEIFQNGSIKLPNRAANRQHYYQRIYKGCVADYDIAAFTDKTIEECKQICDGYANCAGFTYSVNYNDLNNPFTGN